MVNVDMVFHTYRLLIACLFDAVGWPLFWISSKHSIFEHSDILVCARLSRYKLLLKILCIGGQTTAYCAAVCLVQYVAFVGFEFY